MRNSRLILLILAAVQCATVSGAGDRPDPVATVGERTISRSLLDDAVSEALNSQYFHRQPSPQRLLDLEREHLPPLIHRELNSLGGLSQGMTRPEKEAEERRAAIESRLGSEAYAASLKAAGISSVDHLDALATTLLAEQAYRRFVLDQAVVSDAEVEAAWKEQAAQWQQPASAHLFHILLTVPGDASEERWNQREVEAEALKKRIKGGEAFADVAASHSEDMYRIKGGDLGWVHKGSIVKALDELVWTAAPGALIGPVRSADGIHLAMVADRRPARQMDFEETSPMLRKMLEKERLQEVEAKWYASVEASHPVKILDPMLRPEKD